MPKKQFISRNFAIILVYGRPPLIFMGMLCAIAVILTHNPIIYTVGVVCLFVAMSFDIVDGWFAARFHPHSKLSHLADRIMDKIVYSIIFPLVALGMMWRYHFIEPENPRQAILHVIFVLILSVSVLVRDSFAHFMRNFALRKGEDEEMTEITRLRTIVAAPVAALLYAHAFYVPEGPPSALYFWISGLGNIPLRVLFFIEILFLIINFGSVAMYCRKYGSYCLDDLCLGDEVLRRRILSLFPNALTVMNAMMGVLAIFFAYQGRIREAYLILLGAAMFDKLDGAVARKLGLTEPLPDSKKTHQISFGGILDDISDGVSFCLAPAAIFYIALNQSSDETIQNLPYGWVAVCYAVFGIGRLIYFTLDRTPIPGFFKGFPTPGAALWVAAPLIMFNESLTNSPNQVGNWGIFCFAVMITASILMNIYPIRYIHLGRMMGRRPWFFRMTVLVLVLFVFTPYFGLMAFLYMSLYTLSPLLTWRVSPETAEKETKPAASH
ncbi:MAG: CDP-alcohol phosphatidyltransferase family protein [SAR324 cluster bacterium]|nr:CDP-alcohol phosphatidyltransferase family protein [SAR324 cluster bacterium]